MKELIAGFVCPRGSLEYFGKWQSGWALNDFVTDFADFYRERAVSPSIQLVADFHFAGSNRNARRRENRRRHSPSDTDDQLILGLCTDPVVSVQLRQTFTLLKLISVSRVPIETVHGGKMSIAGKRNGVLLYETGHKKNLKKFRPYRKLDRLCSKLTSVKNKPRGQLING